MVRLHRGNVIQGIVLDYVGRAVGGARVFLAGDQTLDLTDGQAERFKGNTATTDAAGRFSLNGAGSTRDRLVVVSDVVHAWLAPKIELGQEAKIILPEPASLVVRYSIPGDATSAKLRLELKTWEMPEWKGITIVLGPFVTNGTEIAITNLAPGTYDFVRSKETLVGDMGRVAYCDRTTLALQSGKVQITSCVRDSGFPMSGEITGLKESGAAGAFIFVKPAGVSGDPRNSEEMKLPWYDATSCGPDGRFQTARLSPGDYTIVANVYRPFTEEQRMRTGGRLPDFIGTAQITISADAPSAPVTIELRPMQ